MTGALALENVLQKHIEQGGYVLGEQVTPGVRSVQTGLSESASVGMAVGLAASGARVVVQLVDASGLERARSALIEAVSLGARAEGFVMRLVVVAPENMPIWAIPAGVRVFAAGGRVTETLVAALGAGQPAVVLVSALHEDVDAALVGRIQEGGRCTLACWGGGGAELRAGLDRLPVGTEVVVLDELLPPAPVLLESVRKTGRLVLAGPVPCGPLLTSTTVLDGQSFWRLDAPPRFTGSSLDEMIQGVNDSLSC